MISAQMLQGLIFHFSSQFQYDKDLRKATAQALLNFERRKPPPPPFHPLNHDIAIRVFNSMKPRAGKCKGQSMPLPSTALRATPVCGLDLRDDSVCPKYPRAIAKGHISCNHRICSEYAAEKGPELAFWSGRTLIAKNMMGDLG
jgi:hypothetical protein